MYFNVRLKYKFRVGGIRIEGIGQVYNDVQKLFKCLKMELFYININLLNPSEKL